MAVRIGKVSSSGGGGDVKSEKDGPALRRSLKTDSRRRVLAGGAVGSVGSETAVAKVREVWSEGRRAGIGGA